MRKDTIVAPATPAGEGGIAIVRLSGPRATDCLEKLFTPRKAPFPLDSHHLVLGDAHSPEGRHIDEIMAVAMYAPHSYTGEDVVELHCHGGPLLVRQLVDACIHLGARLAEPGEFTLRAFLGGRLDLSQSEAVIELIRSRSERAGQAALSQLQGNLSSAIHALREPLLRQRSLLEAYIDFPGEDLPAESDHLILEPIREVLSRVESLCATFDQGRILREGLGVLILGRPNVGKSSLLNALVGEARAIVTEIPGTTRDTLEEQIVIDGIPLRLIDTAGIRRSEDPIEQEGVRRARDKVSLADLVLLMVDGSRPLHEEDRELLELCGDKPLLVLRNKSDLGLVDFDRDLEGLPHVDLSVRSGEGLQALHAAILEASLGSSLTTEEDVMLCDRRHYEALNLCAEALRRFLAGWGDLTLELLALELREALDGLGRVTGETTPDEVLDQIFSRFCIGK